MTDDIWQQPKHEYVIGVDECKEGSEKTFFHCSEIGTWSVDAMKTITCTPIVPGTTISHMSFSREELGDPTSDEWWQNLTDAIGRRVNYINEEFLIDG